MRTVQPKTALSEFITHAVYDVVTVSTAAYLGDDELFGGGIPWSASSISMEEVPAYPLPPALSE